MKAFLVLFHRLTRLHPAERRRDVWLQEEARAERTSNFIRTLYLVAWLTVTGMNAANNAYHSNIANIGGGVVWITWAIGFHIYLLKRPYRPWFKYLSTTMDMLVITGMIFIYQYTLGPAYSLKVPTFLSYFCCMGLAALRFSRGLAFYSGALAMGLYSLLFVYFLFDGNLELGTSLDHAVTSRVSGLYVGYNVIYLGTFTYLIMFLVRNVKRLVHLRVNESESAHRATERAAMAAGVAHEIKNPLEGIYGAAQILRDEGKGNPKFISMILKDAVRLNDVVQQFLQFSRPFSLAPCRMDVSELASDFCDQQNDLHETPKVRFRESGQAALVQADPEGVRQILLNLCQNALRYQPKDKPVEVRVGTRDALIEVAIEDEGPGISAEHQEKLFSPFFTTSSQGTGLGLALSRKIAREMGGELYFTPKEPGARFTLSLRAWSEGDG